ncbi:lipopolysaccharide biosynthesis protein [Halomonas sp. GFAJ-1]|nr:lipopolysaccharide biosynthesis protein [Halomonas sp. GFAJ-1]EHK62024.1 lipopolysaccharide biosynthesis protein [Halomonas sp. GFAJ-1]
MLLVDFVVLLIKQWKIMLASVVCIMLLTLIALWLKPVKYGFVTVYAIASYETLEGNRVGLEKPEEVIAKLDNVFIDQQRRQLLQDDEITGITFDVDVSNPRNTLLLRISSDAETAYRPVVEQFHEGLVASIQEDQHQLVESLTERLNEQYEAYSQALEAARESNSEAARELQVTFFEKMLQLERRIESINPGDSTQFALQSLEPAGIGKKFILAIGIIVALLLTPLVAVFSVFVKQVAVAYRRAK